MFRTMRALARTGIGARAIRLRNLIAAVTMGIALLVSFPGVRAANATQSLSVLFGPICIWAFDLGEDLRFETRNDLAERVSSRIRAEVEAFQPRRKVWAAPGCIQPDKPEFDRQLTMKLSVKRQKIRLDGRDWNLVVAGGVSTNGLFQEHELQPVVIVQEDSVSDDRIVDALVKFVDRVVVDALRRA